MNNLTKKLPEGCKGLRSWFDVLTVEQLSSSITWTTSSAIWKLWVGADMRYSVLQTCWLREAWTGKHGLRKGEGFECFSQYSGSSSCRKRGGYFLRFNNQDLAVSEAKAITSVSYSWLAVQCRIRSSSSPLTKRQAKPCLYFASRFVLTYRTNYLTA